MQTRNEADWTFLIFIKLLHNILKYIFFKIFILNFEQSKAKKHFSQFFFFILTCERCFEGVFFGLLLRHCLPLWLWTAEVGEKRRSAWGHSAPAPPGGDLHFRKGHRLQRGVERWDWGGEWGEPLRRVQWRVWELQLNKSCTEKIKHRDWADGRRTRHADLQKWFGVWRQRRVTLKLSRCDLFWN